MTQRTRIIISNVLIGVSIVCIVTFVVQHFMTPPRPFWHEDLAWIGLVCATVSRVVRGRPRRRAIQNLG